MKTIQHKFVERIPETLVEGIVYVSIPFETVIHKCCCGCGNEVVTPLSPTDWRITFDGDSISLDPSIGNWSFNCKSHYYIRNNRIDWSIAYSEKEIAAVRSKDLEDKTKYFEEKKAREVEGKIKVVEKENAKKKSFWNWLFPKK